MSAMTAVFHGGPLDGQEREMDPDFITVIADERGLPPSVVRVQTFPPDEEHTYARGVHDADDGVTWEYTLVPSGLSAAQIAAIAAEAEE